MRGVFFRRASAVARLKLYSRVSTSGRFDNEISSSGSFLSPTAGVSTLTSLKIQRG